jgi:hypothetical protein
MGSWVEPPASNRTFDLMYCRTIRRRIGTTRKSARSLIGNADNSSGSIAATK